LEEKCGGVVAKPVKMLQVVSFQSMSPKKMKMKTLNNKKWTISI
jgi:hypothetical protein